jgi:3-deoxy-D-manno-octulosonic-acid transferase
MAGLIYRIFMFIYNAAIRVAALFDDKARKFIDGRKHIWEQAALVNPSGKPLFWFHCASLGEFEQARPVIEKCRIEFPSHIILISFFSPSGYEVRKNYSGADHVLYLPMDSPRNADKWIRLIRPEMALFIKYEFWHFYLKKLEHEGIPALSVSAIFREDQSIFRFWGGFQRKMLKRINHFFVQDRKSLTLLREISISNVTVSGDTRFDRVYDISLHARKFSEIENFTNGRDTLIVGSAWPADMEVITPFINEFSLACIIAPHEPDTKFMDQIESDLERKCVRYSEWIKGRQGAFDVMIIDNVGMLSHLYQYARYAWVGGAFGQGLHNILEASVFGVPVFFGNRNYMKFREAVELINLGGAFAVGNYVEFKEKFNSLQIGDTYQIAKETNTQYIQSQLGATNMIIDYMKTELAK